MFSDEGSSSILCRCLRKSDIHMLLSRRLLEELRLCRHTTTPKTKKRRRERITKQARKQERKKDRGTVETARERERERLEQGLVLYVDVDKRVE